MAQPRTLGASTGARKLALAGVLTATAVVGSLFSFPVFGSQAAPIQHMVNVTAAVLLGPVWSVSMAFVASLLRNLMGIGTLMAFPGSMIGALLAGLIWMQTKKLWATCGAEAFGTGVLGGLAAYPIAKFLMGLHPAAVTIYIVPFLISTATGSILAFVVLSLILNAKPVARFLAEGQ